jgi:hypothetical protein
MNKILLGLLLLFVSATVLSQEAQPGKKKVSHRKQLRTLSNEQINQLKDGALLIRLITKSNSIVALRKLENNKLADRLEKKQAEYNLRIINVFKANFTFCPTYFFPSEYSSNVRERQFDKVLFLNENLLADTSIKFDNKNFLTAEFGAIEQDTAKHFSNYSYIRDSTGRLEKVSSYSGGPDMGFGALIIKSDKFIQLKRPFPYYVRTYDSLPINRSPNKVVRKMNKKLNKFYKHQN